MLHRYLTAYCCFVFGADHKAWADVLAWPGMAEASRQWCNHTKSEQGIQEATGFLLRQLS